MHDKNRTNRNNDYLYYDNINANIIKIRVPNIVQTRVLLFYSLLIET